MDQLRRYRDIARQVITEHAERMRGQPLPGEEVLCLFEEATDNYILLRLGWVRGKRLYSTTLHLRLCDGRIHVEQDWTEDAIDRLVAAGVPRDDIVLAFDPPEARRATDAAVA